MPLGRPIFENCSRHWVWILYWSFSQIYWTRIWEWRSDIRIPTRCYQAFLIFEQWHFCSYNEQNMDLSILDIWLLKKNCTRKFVVRNTTFTTCQDERRVLEATVFNSTCVEPRYWWIYECRFVQFKWFWGWMSDAKWETDLIIKMLLVTYVPDSWISKDVIVLLMNLVPLIFSTRSPTITIGVLQPTKVVSWISALVPGSRSCLLSLYVLIQI